MSLLVKIWAATNRGCVRPANEDAICVDGEVVHAVADWSQNYALGCDRPTLVAVVDGTGGHRGGADASRLVAQTLSQVKPTDDDPRDQARHLLDQVNAGLYEVARSNPELSAMGATVAGVWIWPLTITGFNVGDAKLFRLQDGFLNQLSDDHVMDMPSGKRVLWQAMGGSTSLQQIKPTAFSEPNRAGRRYLLCSDGLTDELTLDAMEQCMKLPGNDAVDQLMTGAKAAGGHDNISIIVIDVFAEEGS